MPSVSSSSNPSHSANNETAKLQNQVATNASTLNKIQNKMSTPTSTPSTDSNDSNESRSLDTNDLVTSGTSAL